MEVQELLNKSKIEPVKQTKFVKCMNCAYTASVVADGEACKHCTKSNRNYKVANQKKQENENIQ